MPDVIPILLMTRPAPESGRFVADLEAMGAGPFQPIIAPLIGITPAGAIPDLSDYGAVILTSRHAVRALLDAGTPCTGPAFAVGDATAEAARAAGFDVTSAGGDAETLVAMIRRKAPLGRLVHLRGTHSRGDIAGQLSAGGIPTDEAVIYDQPALPLSQEAELALQGPVPVVAPLFSPRTAALLASHKVRAPLSVAAMSESVAKAVASLHIMELRIAKRPDATAMLSATADLILTLRSCGQERDNR